MNLEICISILIVSEPRRVITNHRPQSTSVRLYGTILVVRDRGADRRRKV